MAFKVTDGTTTLATAEELSDAVTLMAALYTGTYLYVVDLSGTYYASIGIDNREQTAEPLQLAVDETGPLTFSFLLRGVQTEAEIIFGDGESGPIVDDPVEHVYAEVGSYHVVASEGARSTEALLTIVPEPEPPPEPARAEEPREEPLRFDEPQQP